MIFFWLESVELAKDRVQKRVIEGGHKIEPDAIERRYKAGIKNLFHLCANKVDSLLIFDNSKTESELIAEKEIENESFTIHNSQKFNKLKQFPMSNKEREILKEKIKRAIKFSSQKLIEKKKALGQKLVISEEGKIRVIEP